MLCFDVNVRSCQEDFCFELPGALVQGTDNTRNTESFM